METFDAVLFDLFGTLVTEQAQAIDGAPELLRSISPGRWAIVTSCPRELAHALVERAALPAPQVLVCSEDVASGKPAPDCYLLAARKLGAAPERCLVVEDSAHGIAAGVAAGMTVMAVGRRRLPLGTGDVRAVAHLRGLSLASTEHGTIALR